MTSHHQHRLVMKVGRCVTCYVLRVVLHNHIVTCDVSCGQLVWVVPLTVATSLALLS